MVYLGKTSRGTEVSVNRLAMEAGPADPDRRGHLPLHVRVRRWQKERSARIILHYDDPAEIIFGRWGRPSAPVPILGAHPGEPEGMNSMKT